MPSNPYIAGNPVGGQAAFIGRADVLRDVLRMLNNPNKSGLVLYGQRRIGKTSVLLELLNNLPKQGKFLPVYLDLQDKAAKPLNVVLQELAARITEHLTSPPSSSPESGEGVDVSEQSFKATFLPQVLQQLPQDTALVLLFDEFDVMDTSGQQAGSAFFPYFRDLMALDPKRLKFLFVIGRRPADLTHLALSVFKGVKSCHVSLMSPDDTAQVVQLSLQNQTLQWTEDAVTQVYALTGGHPFLTQQLCQTLWEELYDEAPEESPTVHPQEVEHAIPDTLKSVKNALEWLWNGLGPAERVVASALAEAESGVIMQDQLEACLRDSGVRILIGELQNAPNVLEEWDLIRKEQAGYRIPVEMLRRWIVGRKSLRRVQEELDHIQPIAENLFQAAYNLYQNGQLDAAVPLLKQAIGFNPNHLRANQVLAEMYLAQGQLDDAIALLEPLYEYHAAAARPRLVQALIAKAKREEAEDIRLTLYEKVLRVEANHTEVLTAYRHIWEQRGDAALSNERWEYAYEAYQKTTLDLAEARQRIIQALLNKAKTKKIRIIQALLNKAKMKKIEDEQLALYEEVLRFDPTHSEAINAIQKIAKMKKIRIIQALLNKAKVKKIEDEQLALYKEVLRFDPTHSEAINAIQMIKILKNLSYRSDKREKGIMDRISVYLVVIAGILFLGGTFYSVREELSQLLQRVFPKPEPVSESCYDVEKAVSDATMSAITYLNYHSDLNEFQYPWPQSVKKNGIFPNPGYFEGNDYIEGYAEDATDKCDPGQAFRCWYKDGMTQLECKWDGDKKFTPTPHPEGPLL